jgi:NADPH:quinone reductase-like Zn-dependent oxidoreductase
MSEGTMRAMALDHFGGLETLSLHELPLPHPGPTEVTIRVEVAGVGEWDPFEREGGFAAMFKQQPEFPYVQGSDGAGVVVECGEQVRRFAPGDRVYALGFVNPHGFYAEYALADERLVAPMPAGLNALQAGVMGGVGITALRGLEDTLQLGAHQSLIIVGASGGVGHVALQLAKLMNARVLAVASGADGVELARSLVADHAIDGHHDDLRVAASQFAPDGLDAALLTAGGDVAERALRTLRRGARAAYPSGVEPEPTQRNGVQLLRYDGNPDGDILARFAERIAHGPFTVHVARTWPLSEARAAQSALGQHFLGKLALRVS